MVFNKFCILVFFIPLVLGAAIKRQGVPAQCEFLLPIVDDLQNNLFENECGDAAHGALRLTFHDAIGIDRFAGGGGADGSIITFSEIELTFPANDGIDDILAQVGPFFEKYSDVLSSGDFIFLAGAVSLAACPGAPSVQFAMGRPPPGAPSPPNLVPEPFDSTVTILGFEGVPFDSTPSVFDTQFFLEVLLQGAAFYWFSHAPQTTCAWQSFINNQLQMQEQFSAAFFQLSLLGQNAGAMIDCSSVIPVPPTFTGQASYPPTLTQENIEQSCASPFPVLSTQPGNFPIQVPPIPQAPGTGNDGS